MSSSLRHEDKALLFGENATTSGSFYSRNKDILEWQKKSLFEYLFNICKILKLLDHGGIMLSRAAGFPTAKSEHNTIYRSSYFTMEREHRNKHIVDTTASLEAISASITDAIDNKIFYSPDKLSDFNWFYIDIPKYVVDDKIKSINVNTTISDDDYEGNPKKMIYLDVDIKDQYSLLSTVFPAANELVFKKSIKRLDPREKISKLIIEDFYTRIISTDPFDAVFTGNGFHFGYLISNDIAWGTTRNTKKKSYVDFYNTVMSQFRESIILDKQCVNPARVRRLPYTYNYKPEHGFTDPESSILSIVLVNRTLEFPEYTKESLQPLFQYTQQFLPEESTAPEVKTKKKKMTVDEVAQQMATGSYTGKKEYPYVVEAAFKRSGYATNILTKIRLKREKEKKLRWLPDRPTFGEVFNYFEFTNRQSGYKPTPRGDSSFQFAISPFRHRLSSHDKINISEETEGSFRYNDNNGLWFDFGAIPGYKGEHGLGDIFGLIYLMHVKYSGDPVLPDYIDEDGLRTIAELIEKILELNSGINADTLLEVPEDPSRTNRQGVRYLMENLYVIRAVAYNNFFLSYDMIYDEVSQAFLIRNKTADEDQTPYSVLTDTNSPIATMLAHLQGGTGKAVIKPLQYFIKYTPVRNSGNFSMYINTDSICNLLAAETAKLLSTSFYETEYDEVVDEYGQVIEHKAFKVYRMDADGIPEEYRINNIIRIPVVKTSHIILKFKGNIFFHVMEARKVTVEEISQHYPMCRIVPLNDYFPETPYADMDKPLLDELLDPIFDIKGKDNSIVLRYILGCMFTPPNGKTRAVVMLDKGESGKSTFLSVFKGIFPADIHTELNLEHIAGNGKGTDNTAVTARARLMNKCIAFVSDLHNYILPLGFKSYITGDEGAIDYRHLFQESKTMTNQALFLLMGNSMPKITDDFAAFSRRLIVYETKGRNLSKPTIVNLAQEIVKKERAAFLRLMIESIIEFKQYDFVFPCEETEASIGRYVPRAKELVAETIRHIQNAAGLGMPIAPLYYSPGSVLNATSYTQLCVDYMSRANSRNSNNFMGQNDVGKFLVEMLSETSRYADRFMPEKYDKRKLPALYPENAPLLPVIFVKNRANELAYMINVAVDPMSALKGPGMEAPGNSITSRASTLTIDTLLETIMPEFNTKLSDSDVAQFTYIPAVSKGTCYGSENTLLSLVSLGRQIKHTKMGTNTPDISNVKSISSAPQRKLLKKPISSRPIVSPDAESEDIQVVKTKIGHGSPQGSTIIDLDI